MKQIRLWSIRFFAAALGLVSAASWLEADSIYSRPTILVAPEAHVRGDKVTLRDIAKINASDQRDATIVTALSNISLGLAPEPDKTRELNGLEILSAIEHAGIQIESIGYSIPETVKISREGRYLDKSEVFNAVEAKLRADDPQMAITLHDVQWSTAPVMPLGKVDFDVHRLGEQAGGKIPLRIEARVNGVGAGNFLATAVADAWKTIPVVSEALDRGRLIGEENIQLVPVNVFQYPSDIVGSQEEVLGKRVKNRLMAGQPVRKSSIDVPPVIPRGKRVHIIFDNGLMRASATGVAMQDGFEGGIIKVKNESSQKIIQGRILSEHEVEVQLQ